MERKVTLLLFPILFITKKKIINAKSYVRTHVQCVHVIRGTLHTRITPVNESRVQFFDMNIEYYFDPILNCIILNNFNNCDTYDT